MLHYKEKNIEACLAAIEGIVLHGTDNMLKLVFIRHALMSPEKEEKKEEAGDGNGC